MRMLHWPALSPARDSRRLPGGTRKSSNLSAVSSCTSFRSAVRSIATNRGTGRKWNKASVSMHLNDWIDIIVTRGVINVKRDYEVYVCDGDVFEAHGMSPPRLRLQF